MKHPTVQGVGINDADYVVGQGKCPYYALWLSMLQRCYSPRLLIKNPSYIGCSVAPEWHLFSVFKTWMFNKDWVNKCLDKDLLVPGNKVYGPSTCIFITHQVNTLLLQQPSNKTGLPVGVSHANGRFKANFRKNKRLVHIGMFNTAAEAGIAYKVAKANWVEQQSNIESDPATKDVLLQAAINIRKGI
jgi:hypothetical protein